MKKKYLLGAINITLLFLLAIILLISYNYIGIFSSKETILFIIAMLIVLSIIVYTYLSKKTFVYNVGIYTCFMLNIIFIYLINSANLEYNFINNYIKGNVYTTYNIIVLRKNVLYNNISKLENKTIGYIEEDPKIDQNKYTIKKYNSINEMTTAIENAEVQSIILSDENMEIVKEYDNYFYNQTKVIYSYNDIK
jgi:hypothetical protein